jgi:hypothetical protein
MLHKPDILETPGLFITYGRTISQNAVSKCIQSDQSNRTIFWLLLFLRFSFSFQTLLQYDTDSLQKWVLPPQIMDAVTHLMNFDAHSVAHIICTHIYWTQPNQNCCRLLWWKYQLEMEKMIRPRRCSMKEHCIFIALVIDSDLIYCLTTDRTWNHLPSE